MHKNFVFRLNQSNCASSCLSSYTQEADVIYLGVDSRLNHTMSIVERDANCKDIHSMSCTGEREVGDFNIEYSYSSRKGYLLLDDDDPITESLSVQYIIVSPHDLQCFGDGTLQFLAWELGMGWNTILMNWLLVFNKPDEIAYVRHTKTERLQELRIPSVKASGFQSFVKTAISKLSVLIQTFFLFFFCTTLVSFTLNETQERMLQFTQELSRLVARNLPINFLVTTHVLDSFIFCPLMVGKFFFLIEFYKGDRFLAFLFMSVVWFVEVFTVMSLRSYHGITYFPRIFFLLFCLFHIYYFANPSIGFSYLAFAVIVLFIIHSMMFFWHRYELPAVAFGYINMQRPRANAAFHQGPHDLPRPPRVRRVFQVSFDAMISSDTSLFRTAPSS
ncbi:unnamed protein product [Cylindrotheca closterium]|uniref:Uncharacterized protein n=1 Tax=Cylindrotheca closterium TaxID=2856 RepID=A0AAD2CI00_9STRA|nr:unnamed protein product [Cylindrotheca closterium]